MRLSSLAVLALAVLSACGPLQRENTFHMARDSFFEGRRAADPAPEAPITRATFEESPVPLILAARAVEDTVFLMAQSGRNGPTDTFRDETGRSLSMRDGIVIASRGYGDDLMGTDIPGLNQALSAGEGTVARRMSWLGPLDELRHQTFVCQILLLETVSIELFGQQIAARQIGEVCQSVDVGFANNYWVSSNGNVVQSRQWVSPSVGHIDIQRP